LVDAKRILYHPVGSETLLDGRSRSGTEACG
jgi:hypothetical protein